MRGAAWFLVLISELNNVCCSMTFQPYPLHTLETSASFCEISCNSCKKETGGETENLLSNPRFSDLVSYWPYVSITIYYHSLSNTALNLGSTLLKQWRCEPDTVILINPSLTNWPVKLIGHTVRGFHSGQIKNVEVGNWQKKMSRQ